MKKNEEELFKQGLASRRSVRGFLSKPVPQTILDSVFELAQKAPSNCNTQPWKVYVASGSACERLREELPVEVSDGDYDMDFFYEPKYDGVYRERQLNAAVELYASMNIERHDKTGRNKAFLDNFKFFDAPHVAFICLPQQFGLREAADVGMYAQQLMLSMVAHGLASCPQTALSFKAGFVKNALKIDPGDKLLFGISFGYENKLAKANDCRIQRAPLEQNVCFLNK